MYLAAREVAVLVAQLGGIEATRATIGREVAAIGTQVTQLDDRVTRSVVRAPLRGTVLVRVAEPGEVVTAGRPMVVMAALDPSQTGDVPFQAVRTRLAAFDLSSTDPALTARIPVVAEAAVLSEIAAP